jgi:hypothetical protein
MNLLSLLASTMLSQSSVNSVSGKTGLSSKQIQRLVMLALPILIKYMTQNASSGDGALSLLGALSQHKNNNSMDLQLKDADEADGAKIIHHILGKKENAVTQDLSAQTGLGTDQIHQVLSILAPGLMSGVSNAAEANAAQAAQAAQAASAHQPANPFASLLTGGGIFGSILGGGKEEASSAAVNPMDKDGDGRIDGTELLSLLLSASKK